MLKFIFAWLLVLGSAADAVEFVMVRPPPPPSSGRVEVIGGRPASPSDWPVSYKFSGFGNNCTSTAIGRQVILTAAHCVRNHAVGQLAIPGFESKMRCERHNRFSWDDSHDVALCKTDTEIPRSGSDRYERINLSPAIPALHSNLVILGYGCRQEGGPTLSFLVQGPAQVTSLATVTPYIETANGAAVCSGDSGGGAYLRTGSFRRVIVGVASRGNLSTASRFASSAHPEIARFVRRWAVDNQATICGYNESADRCHD